MKSCFTKIAMQNNLVIVWHLRVFKSVWYMYVV